MTEADLQQLVTDAAELYGWLWAHFRPAQTARGWRTPVEGPLGMGFPDLVLVNERKGRVMFVELKSPTGKLSDRQLAVRDYFQSAGAEFHVVRPADFDHFLSILR